MADDPHCKIGRVSFKNGPILRVFESKSPFTSAAMRKDFARNATEIHDLVPDMCGYITVAWRADGSFSRAIRNGNGSPVGETLLPAFVADIARKSWYESNG